eukprot:137812_1
MQDLTVSPNPKSSSRNFIIGCGYYDSGDSLTQNLYVPRYLTTNTVIQIRKRKQTSIRSIKITLTNAVTPFDYILMDIKVPPSTTPPTYNQSLPPIPLHVAPP